MSDITTGLIHHWKFDGNLADSIGGDDFTHSGTPSYIAGQIGQAAVVDNGETLNAGNVADLNFGAGDSFTIAGWLRFSSAPPSTGALLNKKATAGIDLRINNPAATGAIRADLFDGTHNSTWIYVAGTIPGETWLHLAFTLDRGTDVGSLYVNGTLVDNVPGGDPVSSLGSLSNADAFEVISLPSVDTQGDDLRVYDRALSADDMAALYAFRGLLDPAVLKPGLVIDDNTLKPGLVNASYTGGAGTADTLKPSLVDADGNLKRSLVDVDGNLKPSLLRG